LIAISDIFLQTEKKMKLYHYAPKENSIITDGLLSISKVDRNLKPYAHRAGSENKLD
jgi:hypothetical protein